MPRISTERFVAVRCVLESFNCLLLGLVRPRFCIELAPLSRALLNCIKNHVQGIGRRSLLEPELGLIYDGPRASISSCFDSARELRKEPSLRLWSATRGNTCPWRISAHAAIGVWYRPRQCGCQR